MQKAGDRGQSMIKPYYQDEWATVYLGDCREILPQLEPVDLVLTDPPYGIAHSSGMGGRHGDCSIEGDADCSLRDAALRLARFRGAFVFGSPKVSKPAGWKSVLIWNKGEHVGMGDLQMPWKPNFEEIYVLGEGFKGRRDSSVLHFLAVAGCVGRVKSRWHPDEKPVELLRYLLSKHSAGTVLDFFCGSGSTLRAAKDLGIRSIGIELTERHCQNAVKRLRQESLLGLIEMAS
jgi:DNA modification methylase